MKILYRFEGNYSKRDRMLLVYLVNRVAEFMTTKDDRRLFDGLTVVFQTVAIPDNKGALGITYLGKKEIRYVCLVNPSFYYLSFMSELMSHELAHYFIFAKTNDTKFGANAIHWVLNTDSKPFQTIKTVKSYRFFFSQEKTMTIVFYDPYIMLAMRPLIEKRIQDGLDKGHHSYR